MHQVSPASVVETPRPDTVAKSLRQSELIELFDIFTDLEDDLDVVVHEACRVAAEGAGASLAALLQYRADKDAFILQAGIGWPAHLIGCIRVATELGTTAVLCWLSGQLVHFHQLDTPGEIDLPASLVGQGIRGIVSVPIHGECNELFGMLEVITMVSVKFTPSDLAFLQKLADSVAAAVSRYAKRTGLIESQTQLAMWKIDPSGVAPRRLISADIVYQQDARFESGS